MKRFWTKVDHRPTTDPRWLWSACTNAKGYRLFWLDGAARLAHRVAYEMIIGPIPPSPHLDHLYRTRECVNPIHLEPVSIQENTRRGLRDRMAA